MKKLVSPIVASLILSACNSGTNTGSSTTAVDVIDASQNSPIFVAYYPTGCSIQAKNCTCVQDKTTGDIWYTTVTNDLSWTEAGTFASGLNTNNHGNTVGACNINGGWGLPTRDQLNKLGKSGIVWLTQNGFSGLNNQTELWGAICNGNNECEYNMAPAMYFNPQEQLFYMPNPQTATNKLSALAVYTNTHYIFVTNNTTTGNIWPLLNSAANAQQFCVNDINNPLGIGNGNWKILVYDATIFGTGDGGASTPIGTMYTIKVGLSEAAFSITANSKNLLSWGAAISNNNGIADLLQNANTANIWYGDNSGSHGGNCDRWTSGNSAGAMLSLGNNDNMWGSTNPLSCGALANLICVQQ